MSSSYMLYVAVGQGPHVKRFEHEKNEWKRRYIKTKIYFFLFFYANITLELGSSKLLFNDLYEL